MSDSTSLQHPFLTPGFLAAALLGLAGALASFFAVDEGLGQLPVLFRTCLAITVALFPLYAGVRAYRALAEVQLPKWIRAAIALAILVAGHGGIIVVAARQANVGPVELLRRAMS